MGVRIHKVLGYGFRRAKLDRDPRFNPHAIRSLDQAAHEGKFGNGKELRPQMIAFLEEKAKAAPPDRQWEYQLEIRSLQDQEGEKAKPLTYHDVVIYNPFTAEAKPPIGPLLFTIPYQNWFRYDDIIDYHEDSQSRVREDGGPEDKCSFIGDCEGQPAGIYPYCNYVHRANGALDRRLFTASRWELTRVLRQAGQTKLKPGNEFGVKTLVEWQRHIVPEVPLFIRAFLRVFQHLQGRTDHSAASPNALHILELSHGQEHHHPGVRA